jgi:hypothetical protein
MQSISTKSEIHVGFSNGNAELTLKKPPPLVPSCLIATCDAAGPTASPGVVPSVCTTPCETSTSATTIDSGTRM